jgi:hypothetical protein
LNKKKDKGTDMDEKYLFKTICEMQKDAILKAYEQELKRVQSTHIALFPLDLLSYVLSFCTLGDVRAIKLVCKKWCEATENKTFWKRFVEQRVEKQLKDRKKPIFDNFCFPQETLRNQTEWLFRRGYGAFSSGDYSGESKRYWFHRQSSMAFRAKWICDENGIVIECSYGEFTRKYQMETFNYLRNGISHFYYLCSYGVLEINCDVIQENILPQKLRKFVYRGEDDTLFEGEGMLLADREKLAHGGGLWKFADGTTFSGDNVAFAGKPHGHGIDQDGKAVEYFSGEVVYKKRKC